MTRRIAATALLVASFILAPVASPVAHAFDREFAFKAIDKDTMEVSFKAWMGEVLQVCVKPDGAGGDVCDGKNSVETFWVTATPYGAWDRKTSRMTVLVDVPRCGKYKIRVKRSALSFDTSMFYMPC
ncbi:MAG: hypothetical protein IPK80_17620 [Nannocystis sp.]|nr:hypothetical protein [Nannocystis sp.]